MSSEATSAQTFFSGLTLFILPTSIGKARVKLFKNQFLSYGGKVIDNFTSDSVTHFVIDESVDWEKLNKIMKWSFSSENDMKFDIVTTLWLSDCLRQKKLVDTRSFKLEVNCPEEKSRISRDDMANCNVSAPSHLNLASSSEIKRKKDGNDDSDERCLAPENKKLCLDHGVDTEPKRV